MKGFFKKAAALLMAGLMAGSMDVEVMLDATRKIKTEGIEFLFRRFHMLDYYFIYVEPTHSYLATNIPVEK